MAYPSLFYAGNNCILEEKSKMRDISHSPDIILDAPNARDDFYTTLLDWAPTGNLMVGLDRECYIWNRVIDFFFTLGWPTGKDDRVSHR